MRINTGVLDDARKNTGVAPRIYAWLGIRKTYRAYMAGAYMGDYGPGKRTKEKARPVKFAKGDAA
jgi:hypothetical protein